MLLRKTLLLKTIYDSIYQNKKRVVDVKNHYETLGVANFSDADVLKKARRQAHKELQPLTLHGTDEEKEKASRQLQIVNEAYESLKKEDDKNKYDTALKTYLKTHQTVADQVHGTTGAGQGRAAWTEAKPDAKPDPETTTAEPEAQQPQQPEPQPQENPQTAEPLEESDAKTEMMRRKLKEAYGWEDADGEPTIDVRL